MADVASLPTPDEIMAAPEWGTLDAQQRSDVVDAWALETRNAHDWTQEQSRAIDTALDDFHGKAAKTATEYVTDFGKDVVTSGAASLAALPFVPLKLGLQEGKAAGIMTSDATPEQKRDMLAREAPDVLKLGAGYGRTVEGAKALALQNNPLSSNDEAWQASLDGLKQEVLDRKLPEDPEALYGALKRHGMRIAQATAKLHGEGTADYLPMEWQDLDEEGLKSVFKDALSGKRTGGFYDAPDDTTRAGGVTFKNQSRSLVASPENLGLLMQFSATRNPKYWDALVQRLGRSRTRQQQDVSGAEIERARGEDALDVAVRNIFSVGGLAPQAGERMVSEVQSGVQSPVDLITTAFSFGMGRAAVKAAGAGFAKAAGKVALGAGAEFLQGAASGLGDQSVPTWSNLAEQGLLEAGAGGVIQTAGAATQLIKDRFSASVTQGSGGLADSAAAGGGSSPPAGSISDMGVLAQIAAAQSSAALGAASAVSQGSPAPPAGQRRGGQTQSRQGSKGISPTSAQGAPGQPAEQPATKPRLSADELRTRLDNEIKQRAEKALQQQRESAPTQRPVIPDSPLGDPDVLDFLNEHPLALPRKGTTGTAGEYDWREQYDLPRYYRKFIVAKEGTGNPIDVIADRAYEQGFSKGPYADDLMEAVREAMQKRTQYKVQLRNQERAVRDAEQRTVAFEKAEDKAGIKVPLDGVAPGDRFDLGTEKDVLVKDVSYDEDGYLETITIEDGRKFGVLTFDAQSKDALLVDAWKPRARAKVEDDPFASKAAPGETAGDSARAMLDFSPTPQATLSSNERLRLTAVQSYLSEDRSVPEGTRLTVVSPRADGGKPGGRAAVELIAAFEQATGRKVIFVDSTSGAALPFQALSIRRFPDTIVVSARAWRPVLALVGHEWGHTVAKTHPLLYRRFQKRVFQYIKRADAKSAARDLKARGYANRELSEELANNIIGDVFLQPEFWQDLKNRDEPLWNRVVTVVLQWFNEMIARVSASGFGTPEIVQDMVAARREVLQLMDRSAKQFPQGMIFPAAGIDYSTSVPARPAAAVKFKESGLDERGLGEALNEEWRSFYVAGKSWDKTDTQIAEEWAQEMADPDGERVQYAVQSWKQAQRGPLSDAVRYDVVHEGEDQTSTVDVTTGDVLATQSVNPAPLRGTDEFAAVKDAVFPEDATKTRAFGQRVAADPRMNPKVQAQAAQEYTPVTNAETLAQANAVIDEQGLDAAAAMVTDPTNGLPEHVRVALGMQTMLRMDAAARALRNAGEVAAASALWQRLSTLGQYVDTLGTSAGRAVQAFAMWARMTPEGILNSWERQLRKANGDRMPALPRELAAKLGDLRDKINAQPEGSPLRAELMLEMMNEMALYNGVPITSLISALWYANLLSGLTTQGMNVYGNAWGLALRTLSALAVNHPRDSLQMLAGMIRGLDRGLTEARAALKGKVTSRNATEQPTVDKVTQRNALELLTNRPPHDWKSWLAWIGSAGSITKYVQRFMTGVDAAFYYTAAEGRAHLAASRAARQGHTPGTEGFTRAMADMLGRGEAAWQKALDEAAQQLRSAGKEVTETEKRRLAWFQMELQRPPEIREEAARFGELITSQQEPDGSGYWLSRLISLIQQVPVVGRASLPFNKTLANLFSNAWDFTPIGIARGIKGAHLMNPREKFTSWERKERAMAGLIGTTVFATAWAMAARHRDEDDETTPFMIYASGPRDPNKRKQMPKNWKPYTIKIGNHYVSYAETPLVLALAPAGAIMDAQRYQKNLSDKSATERAVYYTQAVLKASASQGMLSSASDFLSALSGSPEASFAKLPSRVTGGMIPAQGLLRDITPLFDPEKIKDDSIAASILRDVPVLRHVWGRADLDYMGDPVTYEGLSRIPVVKRFVADQRTEDRDKSWMGQMRLTIPGFPQTIEPGQYLLSTKERSALKASRLDAGMLTVDEQYQFVKKAGQRTREAVQQLRLKYPEPARLTPEQREEIQKQLDAKVRAARALTMREMLAGG